MSDRFPGTLLRVLLQLFSTRMEPSRRLELERLYVEMWHERTPHGFWGALTFRARMTLDLAWNGFLTWARWAIGRRGGRDRRGDGGREVLTAALGEAKVALRRLRRTPGFTTLAILTLALGISANTVVFTLVNGVYLKPLPFFEPDRLAYLQEHDGEMRLGTSHDAFRYFAEEAASFESLGAYGGASVVLREGEDPVRLNSARVSANLFPMLGHQPFMGRSFLPEEDEPESEAAVILSYSTWQTHFGGRPEVVGSRIRMGSGGHTVVGVMAPDFGFPDESVQCWVTLRGLVREPTYRALTMVGRLTPGTSLAAAGREVMAIGTRLEEENDAAKGGELTYLYPLKDRLVGTSHRPAFIALTVAVAFLLLIAGANLINLLLARAGARRGEVAVRSALGASRWRMVMAGIAEPLLLSMAGGLVGVLGAYWGTQAVLGLAPRAIPRQAEIGVEPGVVLFALTLSIVAGLLIGVASMTRIGEASPAAGLGSGGRVSARHSLLSLFTSIQVALTFALLAGVSLMGRTVLNLQAVDVGFDPAEAFVVNLGLPGNRYPDAAARIAFHDQIVERALASPAVAAAGYTTFLPLEGGWNDTGVLVEGSGASPEELPTLEYDLATPGFLEAMGILLRRGRLFDESDSENAPHVAIVNETAARLHFPDGEALGRRLSAWPGENGPDWFTVVGVVEDVRHHRVTDVATPKFYIPVSQFNEPWPFGLNMVLRMAEVGPGGAVGLIREMVREMDAGGPLVEISPLQARVDRFVEGPRFNTLLLSVFTFAALALSALGLYGVVAFGVTRRRKEIGLRMALGADGLRVQRETLWKGLRLTLAGVLAGVPLALLMGRILSSMLFGVGRYDSSLLAWTTVFLLGVSAAACVLPSLRASRIPPATALKTE